MKIYKYKIRVIVTLLLLLIAVVLVFPLASDNAEIYRIILFCSTGIVILIILFLIWTNFSLSYKSKVHN